MSTTIVRGTRFGLLLAGLLAASARKGDADLGAISSVLEELGTVVDRGVHGKALALALVRMLETLD